MVNLKRTGEMVDAGVPFPSYDQKPGLRERNTAQLRAEMAPMIVLEAGQR